MVTTTRGSARRTVPAALAALALAGGALIAGSAATSSAVGSSAAVTRVAGPDRYATTAALSAATFSPGVPVAYLVSGNDFAGALVAVAAAGGQGPVLFTRPNVLAPATAAELRRLAPRKLIVLASVGDAVAAAASAAANTAATRLGGADPYATAAAVSAVTFPTGGSVAYLAGASDIADGLSGAAAASGSGPMLFVGSSSLPKATASELGRLAPKRLVVLGGPESVSDAVASAAARSAGGVTVTRLGGPDRYATSVQVSTATFADGVRVSASPSASEVSALPTNAARATVAFLATGADFPDALAAAAAAAGRGPVLLVGAKTLPDVVAGELRRLHVSALTVVGGTGAVGARVARVAAAVTAQPIPAPKAGAAAAIALAKAQLGKPYV
jgi:putative cell wall-binding protein